MLVYTIFALYKKNKMRKLLLLLSIGLFFLGAQAQNTNCNMVVVSSFDNACYGGTGSGTVWVEAGSGTINYPLTATLYDYLGNVAYSSTVLTGSGTSTTGSGAVFSIFNLSPDDYTLVVSDDTPCYDSSFVSLIEYNEIVLTATIQDEISGNDGNVFVSVSGGTSPYTYLWSNGSTDPDITGITGGTYLLTVNDDNNCVGFVSVVVQSFVGLSETPEDVLLTAYPNPAKDYVYIKYDLKENMSETKINLYDIRGEKVFAQKIESRHSSGQAKINVSNLNQGVYTYSFGYFKGNLYKEKTGRLVITR